MSHIRQKDSNSLYVGPIALDLKTSGTARRVYKAAATPTNTAAAKAAAEPALLEDAAPSKGAGEALAEPAELEPVLEREPVEREPGAVAVTKPEGLATPERMALSVLVLEEPVLVAVGTAEEAELVLNHRTLNVSAECR